MIYTYHPERFKEMRHKLNIKQRDLATILGSTVVTVQNYESGRREPNGYVVEVLHRLCREQKIPYQSLYDIPHNLISLLPQHRRPK